MDRYGIGATEALNLLAISRPGLVSDIADKARQQGRKEGQKKLKRFRGLRRGKAAASTKKWNYDRYLTNGAWDDAKMDAAGLSAKQQAQMMDDWLKENKPR